MVQRKAEGVVFGRVVTTETLKTYKVIAEMHAAGISIHGIARTLNSDNVPTAKGGTQWYASTVKAVLTSQTLDRLNALAA